MKQKPVMLYVFDGHTFKGKDFDYSKSVETGMFKNKEVVKEARYFTCEKICAEHEFAQEVKGRESILNYLKTMPKRDQRKAHVAFLDARGKLIAKFDSPKVMKMGAPALVKEMRKARKENEKRLAKLKKKAL